MNIEIKNIEEAYHAMMTGLPKWSFNFSMGRVVARVFAWGLTFPEVQHAIVAQFENRSTPLCGALDRAVRDRTDERSIERMIDETVSNAFDEHDRNFEIDADSVKGLSDEIEQVLNNDDVRNDMVNEVLREMANRMRG